MNVFANALQKKIRFQYMGSLSTEMLFDLSLSQLDELYRSIEVPEEGDGLLEKKSENTVASLQKAVVKEVFSIKKAQEEVNTRRAEKAQRNRKILEILHEKQEGALRDKSEEELLALLDED